VISLGQHKLSEILFAISFLLIFAGNSTAASRFWIAAGAANWNNTANWSTTSGGAGGSTVPGSSDVAFFDALGAGNCTITANVTVNGISVNGYTGTITQQAGSNVTVAATGYSQTTGTFTGGTTTFTLNGSFSLSGGTFTATSGSTVVNANWTVSGGTFNANSGTVDFSATLTITGSLTLNNVTLSSAGTKTLAGTMNVLGDLNLTNGTFAMGTYTANRTTPGGTLTIASGATLSIGGTNTLPSNYSTHSIGATSVIDYAGTNQTVAVPNSSQDYGTLTISGSGTKTLAGTVGIARNLTVSAGTFDLGSFTANRTAAGGTLTVSNGATLSIGGTNTIPSNYTTHSIGATSTINYSGASQTVSVVNGSQHYGHLVISGSGTKTLAGIETVRGDLTISAGTFDLGSFTINRQTAGGTLTISNGAALSIGGTGTIPTNYSTHSIGATSTINYSGTNQSVIVLNSAQNYGHLIISGSGTKTLAGAVGVAGNLTVSAGTLALSTFTANRTAAGGTLTVSNGATLSIGGTNTVPSNYSTHSIGATSTINYAGTTQSVIVLNSSQNYGHLTISGSGTKTLAGTVGIAGDLTISAGTFDLSAFTANRTAAGGTLTVSNGATLSIGGTGTIPSNFSTHSIGATSTINYAGTNQTVAVPNSSQNYGHLIISGSGTKTLAGTVGVAGDLTISAGTFDLSTFTANRTAAGGTLTVSNGATLSIGGTGTIPSNYSAHSIGATSTINYSGTNQSIIVLNSAQNYGNLTISGSGTKTLAGTVGVAGNLTVSAGTLDLSTFTANRTAAGGTLTVSNGATLSIGGTGTIPSNYTTHSIGATSNINYAGTNQSVIVLNSAQNYGHLTISGSGTKTLAGTVGVAGDLTISAGTFDLATYTANRTAGGGTLTLSNGAALSIGGTNTLPSNYSTHVIGATSTVNYAGTNQSVAVLNSSQNYGNLTLSGSGTKTLAGSMTVRGTLAISGASLADGGFTLSANGNVNNGTTHTGTGKIMLTGGSGAHSLSGGGSYTNLEMNDANGATLSSNVTVNGTLTLTSGKITTGAYTFSISSTGSVSRTSGHVVGNLQRYIATGSPSATFQIGDATNYTPIDVSLASVSAGGNLTASTTAGDHPNIGSANINAAKSVNRYWTLTNSGIVFTTCTATCNFVAGDLDAGTNTNAVIVGRWSGGAWSYPSVGTRTSTSTQVTGLTAFGDFQIGEAPILSVSVSNATFAFGISILNTWLTPQTSVITNDGNVAESFVGRISQFTDGSNNWGISDVSNGSNIIRAQWSTTSGSGPWVDISAYNTDFTVATNVAVGNTVTLWLRVQTPTSTSSYIEHSSVLTATAQKY
jgi:hypothetical protein